MNSLKVSIIGASGYVGGELLRLLLDHPEVEIQQVTSSSHLGEYVYQQHPNLRKRTSLKFSDPNQVTPCDVLFLAHAAWRKPAQDQPVRPNRAEDYRPLGQIFACGMPVYTHSIMEKPIKPRNG